MPLSPQPAGRRAIFLDVDGTYANHGVVPAAHRDAVRAARAAGHAVFLCTGRPVSLLSPQLLEAGFDGIVAGAGAHVTVGDHVIADVRLPAGLTSRALALLDAAGTQYLLETPEGTYARPEAIAALAARAADSDQDGLEHLRGLHDIVAVLSSQTDLSGIAVTKITAFDGQTPLTSIAAELNAAGGEHVGFFPSSIADLGPGAGELFLARITKAVGLEAASAHLGIARENTVAIGDHLNDLEMIAYAGVGVAMATGAPEAIALADLVVPGPGENGVAVAFELLGLV
jgi:Cof subfamily protein (haloacid dehalogenase superfamily)